MTNPQKPEGGHSRRDFLKASGRRGRRRRWPRRFSRPASTPAEPTPSGSA